MIAYQHHLSDEEIRVPCNIYSDMYYCQMVTTRSMVLSFSDGCVAGTIDRKSCQILSLCENRLIGSIQKAQFHKSLLSSSL